MNELIEETIESYNKYIKNLPLGCQKIADMLREDKIVDAMKNILNFSEGVMWIMDAAKLFEKNNIKSSLNTNKIDEFLSEINRGIEIEDYILVADMFEYEIKPFFEDNQTLTLHN